jgi:hypothetical protein
LQDNAALQQLEQGIFLSQETFGEGMSTRGSDAFEGVIVGIYLPLTTRLALEVAISDQVSEGSKPGERLVETTSWIAAYCQTNDPFLNFTGSLASAGALWLGHHFRVNALPRWSRYHDGIHIAMGEMGW